MDDDSKMFEFSNSTIRSMEANGEITKFINEEKRMEYVKIFCKSKDMITLYKDLCALHVGAKHGNIYCNLRLGIYYHKEKNYDNMIKHLTPVSEYGVNLATQMISDYCVLSKQYFNAHKYYEKLRIQGNDAHIDTAYYRRFNNNTMPAFGRNNNTAPPILIRNNNMSLRQQRLQQQQRQPPPPPPRLLSQQYRTYVLGRNNTAPPLLVHNNIDKQINKNENERVEEKKDDYVNQKQIRTRTLTRAHKQNHMKNQKHELTEKQKQKQVQSECGVCSIM